MSRTLACSALLLAIYAIPPASRAGEPAPPVNSAAAQAQPGNGGQLQLSTGTTTSNTAGQPFVKVGTLTISDPSMSAVSGTTLSAGGPAGAETGPTLMLNGVSTYTGPTTVSAGVLSVSAYATDEANWSAANAVNVGYGFMMGATAPRSSFTPIPKGPVFYIITEGAGLGDSVRTVPCTGKETVLSAVGAVGGITQVSSKKMWIARPAGDKAGKSTVLPVDWDAISKRGDNATNYTLAPGDRLVFGEDPLVTTTNLLGKKIAPLERMSGVASLVTSTLRGIQQTPGGAKVVTELVEGGYITDDKALRKFLLDLTREAPSKKAATKTDAPKPRDSESQLNTGDGKLSLELKVEREAEKPNRPENKGSSTFSSTFSGTISLDAESSRAAAAAPHELAMQSLPAYRIEPPDMIQLEMAKLIPLPPYRTEVFDVLQIKADTPVDKPIDNYYMIEPEGAINLGPAYGSVKVKDMTLNEVRKAVDKHLSGSIKNPNAFVQLARSSGAQPVTGQYLVGPDGTINLRKYGLVAISGKTVAEAKAAIEDHLKKFLESPEVTVNVAAYNSKVYFVITQGAGFGDSVRRLPITGNETVLDAISQIGGLTQVSSSKNICIVRPSPSDPQKATILPVDWDAISRRGATATNYQIYPRDRLYIGQDPLLTSTNLLGKKTAPIERAMGIISLTTSTVRGMNVTPGGVAAVKKLAQKGAFDDDPELKRTVRVLIRLGEEQSSKAGGKPSDDGKSSLP